MSVERSKRRFLIPIVFTTKSYITVLNMKKKFDNNDFLLQCVTFVYATFSACFKAIPASRF